MRIKLIIIALLFALTAGANPWHTKTKHKPVKKMTRHQVRQAQVGRTLYYRCDRSGKVEKNLRTPWSTPKKPTSYNEWHLKSKKAEAKAKAKAKFKMKNSKLKIQN